MTEVTGGTKSVIRAIGLLSLVVVVIAPACGDTTETTQVDLPSTTTVTPAEPASSPPPSTAAATGVEHFVITDKSHADGPITYAQDPPAGGPHAPIWQECGFYHFPISSENAVHALEHGAVWITYQPDLAPDQIDELRKMSRMREVLVSPYPGLDSPVVATSWGHQLRLGSADDPRLEDFISEYLDGPDAPEPAAGCNDGRGLQTAADASA